MPLMAKAARLPIKGSRKISYLSNNREKVIKYAHSFFNLIYGNGSYSNSHTVTLNPFELSPQIHFSFDNFSISHIYTIQS